MNSETYEQIERAGLLEHFSPGGIFIDESIPTGMIVGRAAPRAVMSEGSFRHQFHSKAGLADRKAKRKASRDARKVNRQRGRK